MKKGHKQEAGMKKVINFGSINIDHVYQVDHLVNPGETLASDSYQVFPGGKGLNQSVALAKAGVDVTHVGKIGDDGLWLREYLEKSGVDTVLVKSSKHATGHAMIQVSKTGENSIIIHSGANRDLDANLITEAFSFASPGDFLLVQNEINSIADIIKTGHEQGLIILLNPAPMNRHVLDYPLEKIDWLIVNETEGEAMTGQSESQQILTDLNHRLPTAKIVLTLGDKGLLYIDSNRQMTLPAYAIKASDTTATGDTFIGFLLSAVVRGKGLETALSEASAAAAICATRVGAASSIPDLNEVQKFLEAH
jgi:ribokinase